MDSSKSILSKYGMFTICTMIAFLAVSCKDTSNDPGPGGASPNFVKGTIADTCLSGFVGSAVIRLNNSDSSIFDFVFSQCQTNPEGEYLIAGSQDSLSSFSMYFKGMPRSGNFRLIDFIDFRASNQVDQLYVLYTKGGTTYSSRSEGALILVTNSDKVIRIRIPMLTYNRVFGVGSSTVRFSLELEHSVM